MNKLDSLRTYLRGAIPALHADPQQLKVFVESGRMVGRSGGSLSFEYRFTLRLVLLDFAGSLDLLAVPLMAWLNLYQPDLLQNKESAAKGVRFEAEPLANDKMDVVVELDLTEMVVVNEDKDGNGRTRLTATHKGEVLHPLPYAQGDYTLYLGDKIGAEWHLTQGIQ
ncbi:MAG: phage tail protein [Acidovorax sp.]|jgi:hypothetical protein|nr:phage tail protein [Acidovorax sp.]